MKKLQTAHKMKQLSQYSADIWVYNLVKPLKRDKKTIEFVLISKQKPITGKPVVTVMESDMEGTVLDNKPILILESHEISDALLELGYNLI